MHCKSKARTPYEFSVKVLVLTTLKEKLVVGALSMPGNPYDRYALHEALEQAAILSEPKPLTTFVDRGFLGMEVRGAQIWELCQRRGVTRGIKAIIKRRSAIESTIDQGKNDG